MGSLAQDTKDLLGINISCTPWSDAAHLPLALADAAEYSMCEVLGIRFVAAEIADDTGLPALKRTFNQISRRTDEPVVVVSEHIDPRQRKALVAQNIPFIVPKNHLYLPFVALVARKGRHASRVPGKTLSACAQAALVTLLTVPGIGTARELRERTGMTASSISKALDELESNGSIIKGKVGRLVTVALAGKRAEVLTRARNHLSNPIQRSVFARASKGVGLLPDAGETALAKRSMLSRPRIAQKAVSRKALKSFRLREVLEGELPDEDTVEVQVWAYNPLVAGFAQIDNVSLALSLIAEGDERVDKELSHLFGQEEQWW